MKYTREEIVEEVVGSVGHSLLDPLGQAFNVVGWSRKLAARTGPNSYLDWSDRVYDRSASIPIPTFTKAQLFRGFAIYLDCDMQEAFWGKLEYFKVGPRAYRTVEYLEALLGGKWGRTPLWGVMRNRIAWTITEGYGDRASVEGEADSDR